MRGFIFGVIFAGIVAAAVGAYVFYSGVFDMAASHGHPPLEYWVFENGKVNAVLAQSKDIQVPSFTQQQILEGTAYYGGNCSMCHGTTQNADIAPFIKGMLPEPPNVVALANKWEPAQLFWIAKNGLKMTGMPATGSHITDDQLWQIVAYVHSLQGTTPPVPPPPAK